MNSPIVASKDQHVILIVFLCVGKLGSEEEIKEEFKMEREPPATHEEGNLSLSLLVWKTDVKMCVCV